MGTLKNDNSPEILKIFGSRQVKQEIAEQGLKPADKAGIMLKVMIISMFRCFIRFKRA